MNHPTTGLKLLLQQLHSGAGLRAQLARGSLQGLVVTALGIGVSFVVQVALARLLGVKDFGIYSWALASVNVLMLIACSGLEGLTVRRLPAYLIERQFGHARGFLLFTACWVGGCGLLGGVLLYAVSWLSQTHILPGSLATLAICIGVIPLFALAAVRQAVLRALKRVARGQLLEAVVRPIFLALFALMLVYVFGMAAVSETAMLAQLFASALVFVVGGLWVVRALPPEARMAPPAWAGRSWLKEAFPFLAISGASAISGQVGTLALGTFGTAADTGIYAAISRLADFVLMGTFSVSAIASPLIVEVLQKNDRGGFVQILKWGARGAVAFAVVAVLGLALFGDWILAAFGKAFVDGHGALHVMLGGALCGAFAGLSGFVLAMSGHAQTRAAIGWSSAACNLLISIALVPAFGVYGAAFGYALAMLFDGILCVYFCWRYHRVWAGLR